MELYDLFKPFCTILIYLLQVLNSGVLLVQQTGILVVEAMIRCEIADQYIVICLVRQTEHPNRALRDYYKYVKVTPTSASVAERRFVKPYCSLRLQGGFIEIS